MHMLTRISEKYADISACTCCIYLQGIYIYIYMYICYNVYSHLCIFMHIFVYINVLAWIHIANDLAFRDAAFKVPRRAAAVSETTLELQKRRSCQVVVVHLYQGFYQEHTDIWLAVQDTNGFNSLLNAGRVLPSSALCIKECMVAPSAILQSYFIQQLTLEAKKH